MRINRRAFLRGHVSTGGVHISSLVVHCRPEMISSVIDAITAMPEAEVPEHSEQGKLVVLLETPGEGVILERISAIENLPGVINTAMVYHQIDTDADTDTEQDTGT